MLALLLVVVLLTRLELVRVLVRALFDRPDLVLVLVGLLLLVPLLVAIAGLWALRVWGVYALYLLVPIATLAHGISLVPFVTGLLPEPARPPAVAVLNTLVLFAGVYVRRRLLPGSQPTSA